MQKLILILLLSPVIAVSQVRTVTCRVISTDSLPVAGADITVNGKHLPPSDSTGIFVMPVKETGNVHLRITATSYRSFDSVLAVYPKNNELLFFVLSPNARELDHVQITQKTTLAELKQSMQQVTVVDARKFYNRSSGAIDVLGQAAGVRIRQDGGLGSRADFAINGISGKQVKIFIDGIPATYFGSGAGLNTLPVNVIDRIEVYKGVVPVFLGADALGGAINIVTRKQTSDFLEASYAISSFNTHRATVNGQLRLRNQVFVNTSVFYNHSDNNYSIEAEVPNQYGNPVVQKLKRFHDRFNSYYAAAEIGVENKKWADLASVSASYSGMQQQVQHNVVMTQPYGKVTYGEQTFNGYLKYAKKEVLPGMAVSFFGGIGNTSGHFIDTSLNAYSWDGTVVNRRNYGGEISSSRNNLLLKTLNTVGRLTTVYAPDSLTLITFNVTATLFNRKGKDSVAAAYYGKDYYTSPTDLFKTVLGLSAERVLIRQKLTSLTSIKYYTYRANGFVVNNSELFTMKVQHAQWGVAQSFRYIISPALFTRLSYEYAVRLPDDAEAFGDFVLTRANPGLQPEKSHNLNLGVQYRTRKLRAEVTGFYRHIDDIIYLKASQFFAQYQNLLKAQITGVEGEVNWQPHPFVQLQVNATYQNIINKSLGVNSGTTDDRYYNLRLPNIPYLFSNAVVQFTKPDLIKKGNAFSWWYTASYVHQFYLYWAIDGRPDQKATIPSQFIQNTGVSYALHNNRYAVSIEMQNLGNAKAFDNFSVQKPGRSIHFKLKTFIQ